MKDKIREALAKLQRAGDVNGKVSFTYKRALDAKSLKARVFYNASSEFDLELLDIVGYNEAYVRQKTKSLLTVLKAEVLRLPSAGDTVWTKERLTGLQPGDTVLLPKDIDYFAIDTGLIDCNGRQLPRDFNARFVRYENAACSPGGVVLKYSLFLV